MALREVPTTSIRFSPAMVQTLEKKKVKKDNIKVSKYLNDDISQHRANDLDKFVSLYRKKPTSIPAVVLNAYYMRYNEKTGPVYEYEIVDGRHRVTSAAIIGRKTVRSKVVNLPELCIRLYEQGIKSPLLWHLDNNQMPNHILEECLSSNSVECARVAISKGADPNKLDIFTYLVYNEVNHKMVDLLLEAGANLHVTDEEGNNPIIYTFMTCDSFEFLSQYHKTRIKENVRYLCSKFFSINDVNHEGNTALMELCKKSFNDVEAVSLLTHFGDMKSLTKIKNEKGLTAASYIEMKQTSHNRDKIMKLLRGSSSWGLFSYAV